MATANNLPQQLTSFVGREREVAEVTRLLASTRLLTLTGAGGSGKTRLSEQIASNLLNTFEGGVFLVSLAPIRDPALVISAIAQVLGVREDPDRTLSQVVTDTLRDKKILLLLDNFEQVLDAAPSLAEILSETYHLTILVTSREALHLYGEAEYAVQPLSMPESQSQPVETLSQYDAVTLFVQRARAINHDFQLTADNALTVVRICQRLDGLPLAIELAAARIKVLPPRALLPRLENRLRLLTGGPRNLPARQQTLRAAIDWSYDLLSEKEKRLFRRLAVFVGGSTLPAIEAVCNPDGDLEMDVLEGVASLVGKSLLIQREGSGVEARYFMLETIHEYAMEKLQESGEEDGARIRHAHFFLMLAEEAEPRLYGAEQEEWYGKLEGELANLRAAVDWFERGDEDIYSIELGLRLLAVLERFRDMRGNWEDARERLDIFIARARRYYEGQSQQGRWGKYTLTYAQALNAAGRIAWRHVDYTAAHSLFTECLGVAEELGERTLVAKALNNLGNVVLYQFSDYPEARSLYERSLQIRRELRDELGILHSIHNLGLVARGQGDYAAARSLFEEGLAMWRQRGDKWGVIAAIDDLAEVALLQEDYTTARNLAEENLVLSRELGGSSHAPAMAHAFLRAGWMAANQGDYPSAREYYQENIRIWREEGNRENTALALALFGDAMRRTGDLYEAGSLIEESLTISRELKNTWVTARALLYLGILARDLEENSRAIALLRESLTIWKELGNKEYIGRTLLRIAQVTGATGATGAPQRGATLLGAADSLYIIMGTTISANSTPVEAKEYERYRATSRAQVGEAAWQAAWTEGRAMTLEQAIELALSDLPELEHASNSLPSHPQPYPNDLTQREVEVLRLVAEGLTSAQIAERLFLSRNTVHAHLHSIYSKVGVSTRSAAARFATAHGLID